MSEELQSDTPQATPEPAAAPEIQEPAPQAPEPQASEPAPEPEPAAPVAEPAAEAPAEAPAEAAPEAASAAAPPAPAPRGERPPREPRPDRGPRGERQPNRERQGGQPQQGREQGKEQNKGGRPDQQRPAGDRNRDNRGDRGDRRPEGRRPEGPIEIEFEKLISDSLYLDNQAHVIVARLRDLDAGTRSQLRRLYGAVRRACRAPEADRQHQFVMLRARLAYTIARHGLRSLDPLEKLLLQVTRRNETRGYDRFRDLFEAIIAYNE